MAEYEASSVIDGGPFWGLACSVRVETNSWLIFLHKGKMLPPNSVQSCLPEIFDTGSPQADGAGEAKAEGSC